MAIITYVEHDGTVHVAEGGDGFSVMEVARINSIPGIVADCGGVLACATCHVYVDTAWAEQVGVSGEDEDAMLDFAHARASNSRLSCQIRISALLDGLVVRMPERQG